MRPGLLRHPLGGGFDARSAFEALHPAGDAFWLDSGPGGRAFIGTGARIVLPEGEVLATLRRELAALRTDEPLGAVPLGLLGWFGYELRGETTGMPVRERGAHPDAAFLRVDRLLVVEADGTAELLALGAAWEGELVDWRDAVEQVARDRSAAPRLEPTAPTTAPPSWRDDDATYLANVRACQAAIHEGEALYVELPTSVILEVTYTEPGLQGDRSSAGTKPATVETGYEIQVPLFLETGTKVKVDTRSGDYLGRV